jgi:hypothetical protein
MIYYINSKNTEKGEFIGEWGERLVSCGVWPPRAPYLNQYHYYVYLWKSQKCLCEQPTFCVRIERKHSKRNCKHLKARKISLSTAGPPRKQVVSNSSHSHKKRNLNCWGIFYTKNLDGKCRFRSTAVFLNMTLAQCLQKVLYKSSITKSEWGTCTCRRSQTFN